eukprot:6927779-Prymnesium_polylepis.1
MSQLFETNPCYMCCYKRCSVVEYAQCGGAGRGSVALTGSRHRQYPRSSFLHEVALGLWSKLWTPFERLAEIPK